MRERERERESIQWPYLGRVEGENGFTVYLAFRRRVSSESIFFNGLVEFYGARLEASVILSKSSISLLHPEFWHEIRPSVHGDLRPLNWFLSFYFRWRMKKATSVFRVWPIIRPLSPSFTLSGDSFGLLYVPIPPSLSIQSQNANICWFSFWPGFVTSAARNWPTVLIRLLTVHSLAAC